MGCESMSRPEDGIISNPIEPLPPTPNGHAGGDIASEELVGHGHFVTHFDEPSLDYSVSETKISPPLAKSVSREAKLTLSPVIVYS